MLVIAVMLAVNLVIIWFMPKGLTKAEIYVTWAIVSLLAFILDGANGNCIKIVLFL